MFALTDSTQEGTECGDSQWGKAMKNCGYCEVKSCKEVRHKIFHFPACTPMDRLFISMRLISETSRKLFAAAESHHSLLMHSVKNTAGHGVHI